MVYITYILITFSIILLDQVSKYLVVQNFALYEKKEIIRNFFYLKYVTNDGASFSIFPGQTTFLLIVSAVATVLFVYFLIKSKKSEKLKITALLFMIGGNIGNFIDRIRFKEVTDFISLKFGGWEFATFNIADSFMVVGVAMLILDMLMEERRAKN